MGCHPLSCIIRKEYAGDPAFTVQIHRDGHVLHTIAGDPAVFNLIFLEDGARIAITTGPLHSGPSSSGPLLCGLSCALYDAATGRELARIDCDTAYDATTAPDWAKAEIGG